MKLGEWRLRVVNYFDDLVNDVDLRAEQALAQRSLNEYKIERVNKRREELIGRIRQVQDHNLAHLDKTYKEEEFEGLGETDIDIRLFNKFCFLFDASRKIKYTCSVDRLFGHFVVVDQFVREDTLAAFRQLLQCDLPKDNLLFEMEETEDMLIKIESDVFRADNLMMECTTRELFRLELVEVNGGIIKSIKEPAGVLFENIQQVDYIIDTSSQEHIESIRMIARSAGYVHISCDCDEFDASRITMLSDIKIKSLHLSVPIVNQLTDNAEDTPVAQPFRLANLMLSLVHLEQLQLSSKFDEDLAAEQYSTVKFDRLKNLLLDEVEVDVEFIECFENLNELVLERVPETAEAIMTNLKLMKQIKSVGFAECSLRKIKAESFQGLESITSLDLSSNEISQINENAFLHLKNLTRLDLSGNSLDKLKASAFNGLTSLTDLILLVCQIATLDDNLFNGLRSLTCLDLSDNQLTTICQSISGLSLLRELNLGQNGISTLDSHIFEQLAELETLDLSNNFITSIKPNVFQGLTKLKKLYLRGNRISSIEAGAFHGLSVLKTLDLSHNIISSIEPTAFKPMAVTLEYLDLDRNQLRKIDFLFNRQSSLVHLQSLKEVHLGHNCIEKLEFRIRPEKLDSLRHLNLKENRITYIKPNLFSLFPQLEELELQGNQITELKKETFWRLESLLKLDLSRNKIEHLEPKLFKSQRCLERLNIGSNALQAITCDTFSANLVSLERLDLSNNQITSIQAKSFAHLPLLDLEHCDLSDNKGLDQDKTLYF